MNNKRKTLHKIASIGVVTTVVPISWIKPVVSGVLLPAHAQTSEGTTISDVSCPLDTATLGVGTRFTARATIVSIDVPLDSIQWSLFKNGEGLDQGIDENGFGSGQFISYRGEISENDVENGSLEISLVAYTHPPTKVLARATLCDLTIER